MDIQNNTPLNPNGLSLLWKISIWLIVWLIFSALVFVMFIWLWTTIDQAVSNSVNGITHYPPLVWLSFLAISALISIVWSIVIAWIYNIIWSEDYYDMRVISSSILIVNVFLLIPFLFLYGYIWTTEPINKLFLVYGFHLFFAIYISFVSIDIVKNPNYSAVYVIGNSFGFIITILIFFIIYSLYSTKVWSYQKNILFFPPILAFSIIPFVATLFEKVYYKFYEMWNDILYIPSLSEVMVDEEDLDEVNVDIK